MFDMKKCLFFAATLLFSAAAFLGCNDNDDNNPSRNYILYKGMYLKVYSAKETFLGWGTDGDLEPGFNMRFIGKYDPTNEDEKARALTFFISVHDMEAKHLPEGTYHIDPSKNPNLQTRAESEPGVCWTVSLSTNNDKPYTATSGTLRIAKDGKIYTYEAECNFPDGEKVVLKYDGRIVYEDMSDPSHVDDGH